MGIRLETSDPGRCHGYSLGSHVPPGPDTGGPTGCAHLAVCHTYEERPYQPVSAQVTEVAACPASHLLLGERRTGPVRLPAAPAPRPAPGRSRPGRGGRPRGAPRPGPGAAADRRAPPRGAPGVPVPRADVHPGRAVLVAGAAAGRGAVAGGQHEGHQHGARAVGAARGGVFLCEHQHGTVLALPEVLLVVHPGPDHLARIGGAVGPRLVGDGQRRPAAAVDQDRLALGATGGVAPRGAVGRRRSRGGAGVLHPPHGLASQVAGGAPHRAGAGREPQQRGETGGQRHDGSLGRGRDPVRGPVTDP